MDSTGSRQVTFEVNGERRFFRVTDERALAGDTGGGSAVVRRGVDAGGGRAPLSRRDGYTPRSAWRRDDDHSLRVPLSRRDGYTPRSAWWRDDDHSLRARHTRSC